MDYKTKKNNNATVDIKITFTPEEIEESFQKAYKKASAKIKVPGFRPGKAPVQMVEKLLGDSVAEDAINLLIQDTFRDLYPKLEFTPVYPPKFTVESFDRTKSLIVKGVYETRPEVTLPKYKKMKIEVKKLKITDDDLQDSLQKISEKMARTQLKEEGVAEIGDLVEIDYAVTEVGDSKPPLKQKVNYKIGEPNNPVGFDEKLIGVKKGEQKEFDYTFPADYPAHNYAGKTYHYNVNVEGVYQINYPEINDDLAMEWSGSGSLQEMKDTIRKELSEYHETALKSKYVQEIFEKIYDEAKYIIPDSLIHEETENVFKQFNQETHLNMTMEQYAEMLKKSLDEIKKQFEEIALKRIKSAVTKYKIAEEEKIVVSPEDFEKSLEKYATEINQTLDSVKKEIKKNKLENYFREKFLFDKINDFIYDVTEKKGSKEISVKEVADLVNGASK